ncbi:MAG: hypothetical protein ACRDRK_18830 [Pseudonocardia sp.]
MAWWGVDLTAKPPQTEPYKPVWVDLDQLYPHSPAAADGRQVMPDYGQGRLVLSGQVLGQLRQWRRATDGRWVGLVDFRLYDDDGSPVVFHTLVAVPAAALTPVPKQTRR